MNDELIILPDAYRRRTAVFGLAMAFVLALLFWKSGVSGPGSVPAFSLVLVVSLGGLLSFETRISPGLKRVVRLWNLGGLVPVWKRVYPFGYFRGVQCVCVADGEHNLWQVGLVTGSGGFLMITYFTSRTSRFPARHADRFRDYLAGLMGMRVLNEQKEA